MCVPIPYSGLAAGGTATRGVGSGAGAGSVGVWADPDDGDNNRATTIANAKRADSFLKR
jgi:hypothetical protein